MSAFLRAMHRATLDPEADVPDRSESHAQVKFSFPDYEQKIEY
jgi:hypothetical protein